MRSPDVVRVLMIGGGVHAAVVAECVRATGKGTVVGYVDLPEHDRSTMRRAGVVLLGSDEDVNGLVHAHTDAAGILGIAGLDHAVRRMELVEAHDDSVAGWWTAIHPSAVVAESASIGDGTLICPGAVVNPHARVGRHVVINTGAVVEHHCVIEDFVVISPLAAVCGGVRVRRGAFVGAGAVVVTDLTIGEHSIVAAGAVVIDDVPAGAKVVGNPARVVNAADVCDIEATAAP